MLAFAGVTLCAVASRTASAAPARNATLPSVSPDGKRIAFLSDRDDDTSQVYVVGTDGSGLMRVTRSPGDKRPPRWSRDGKRIVYASGSGDTTKVWSIAPSGGEPTLITALPAKSLELSPDGRRVAYTSGSWTRNRIVVARVDGSQATAITDSSVGFFNLAWSPDGKRLAATRRDTTGELQVWLIDADGGGARPLTRFDKDAERPQVPAWSPDGKRVAIQSGKYDRTDPTKSTAHIWVIDVATGKGTQLAPHGPGRLDETPAWFPDGKRLAFQSDRAGAFDVWIMNVDGSGERRVTH